MPAKAFCLPPVILPVSEVNWTGIAHVNLLSGTRASQAPQ
jgi:hypothetical protein